jgi:hypothetical protein
MKITDYVLKDMTNDYKKGRSKKLRPLFFYNVMPNFLRRRLYTFIPTSPSVTVIQFLHTGHIIYRVPLSKDPSQTHPHDFTSFP